MSTLKAFSEQKRAYHAYQAQQNYLREQRSLQRYLKTLQAEKEQERAAKEAERQTKKTALAEIAQLKVLLRAYTKTNMLIIKSLFTGDSLLLIV